MEGSGIFAFLTAPAFKQNLISLARERGEITSFENSTVGTARNYTPQLFHSSPEARDRDSSAATNSKIISQAESESAFPLLDLKTIEVSVQQDASTATAPISNYSKHTLEGNTLNHLLSLPSSVAVESPSPTFPGRPTVHSFLDDNPSKPKF